MMGPAAATSTIPKEAAFIRIVSVVVFIEKLFQELSAIVVVVIEGRGDFIPVAPARQPLTTAPATACSHCLHPERAVIIVCSRRPQPPSTVAVHHRRDCRYHRPQPPLPQLAVCCYCYHQK